MGGRKGERGGYYIYQGIFLGSTTFHDVQKISACVCVCLSVCMYVCVCVCVCVFDCLCVCSDLSEILTLGETLLGLPPDFFINKLDPELD